MIKTDWYTNKTWNGKIDSNFEDHLKRARGANNKAAFLQIQGCLLLENSQPNIQAVGLAILSRLLEDFPLEYSSILLAQEKIDRKSTRLNSSHPRLSRMPSSA